MPLDLLLCSNLVQQDLSRMNINSLSLLDKMVQVTPQVMRMLGGLLERVVTKDDSEWAAAMASLTISEKLKIMLSRRQHKENERDCGTIVQQIVSSLPPRGFKQYFIQTERTGERLTKETVTSEEQQKEGEEVDRNLSGETNGEERVRNQDQNPGQESFSGSLMWKRKFLMRKGTWKIRFCPGSSDG